MKIINYLKKMPLDEFVTKSFWIIISIGLCGLFLGMVNRNPAVCIFAGTLGFCSIILYLERRGVDKNG